MTTKTTPENVAERFWSKVDRRGPDECWPWTAATYEGGYGCAYDGTRRQAAQLTWEFANGEPFPDGKEACHTCDNPPCCNPAHVFPDTHHGNIKDRMAKGRTVTLGGALSGMAKLSWEIVGAIRHAHAKGESKASISRSMNIPANTVGRVVRCESWGMLHANGGPDHG